MKAVVLIEPVSSGAPLKKAAKELGYRVVAIFAQSMEAFKHLLHLDQEEVVRDCDDYLFSRDFNQIDQWIRSLGHEIQAVIGASELGVELADQLAAKYGLFCNPIQLSKARRDKGEMRKVLQKSGLSCPGFALCSTEDEAREFAKTHRFPLMIKTPKGALTAQVYYCETIEFLIDRLHEILTVKDLFSNVAAYAVVEEFIGGTEYVIDTFSDGKEVHLTDAWMYEKINLGEARNLYYNVISIPLDDPLLRAIRDYGIEVAKVFGVVRGPTHIEIKDDPHRGPTLIEIGVRLAGARMPMFVEKYSNFDPYKATIEVFAKGRIDFPRPLILSKHFALVMCPLLRWGKVKNFEGVEAIEKLPSYQMHSLHLKKGETVAPSIIVITTPLIVYLAHENRAQLLHDVQAVHDLFVVHFD
jgi:biotin carboxylase